MQINKNGFTLIELLAVIVILAILLVIAVPRVLDVIEESEKESLVITAKQLLRAVENNQIKDSETGVIDKTYVIENGSFVDSSIKVSGELPESGTIQILKDGKTAIAVIKDKWCIKKDFEDNNVIINNDINNCKALKATDSSCFLYSENSGKITITGYNKDVCTANVVIPKKINDIPVEEIGFEAFKGTSIDSVYIPNSVITIKEWSFTSLDLTNVVIPNSVTKIETGAFYWNLGITSLIIPNSVQSIGYHAFNDTNIIRVEIPYNIEIYDTSISSTFYEAYVTNNNKAAGVYTATSRLGVWTKQ